MKSYFTKFGAFLLCGVMLAAVGCHDYGEDIQQVNDKVDNLDKNYAVEVEDLEKAIAELDAKCATDTELASKISELQNTVNTTIDGKVTELQNAIGGKADASAIEALEDAYADADKILEDAIALKADATTVTALQTLVNENKTALDALKSEVSAANLTELKANVASLQTGLNTAAAQVETNKNDIATLKSDLTTAKANISDNAAAIKTLTDANLITRVQAIEDAGYVLETALTAKLNALTEAYKGADAELKEELGDEIAAVSGQITEIETTIDDIEEKIDSIETTLDGVATAQALTDAIAGLRTELEGKITTAIEGLENRVEILEGLVTKIQKVVYIPTSAEGKATLSALKLNDGTTFTSAPSKISYKVYPYELAKEIAVCAAIPGALSFDVVGVTKAPADPFSIIAIEGNSETGILDITYVANKEQTNTLYTSLTESYSAAFVIEMGNDFYSTEYTNITKGAETTISMVLEGELPVGEVYAKEISYANILTKWDVYDGVEPKFVLSTDPTSTPYTVEQLNNMGYGVTCEVTTTPAYSDPADAALFVLTPVADSYATNVTLKKNAEGTANIADWNNENAWVNVAYKFESNVAAPETIEGKVTISDFPYTLVLDGYAPQNYELTYVGGEGPHVVLDGITPKFQLGTEQPIDVTALNDLGYAVTVVTSAEATAADDATKALFSIVGDDYPLTVDLAKDGDNIKATAADVDKSLEVSYTFAAPAVNLSVPVTSTVTITKASYTFNLESGAATWTYMADADVEALRFAGAAYSYEREFTAVPDEAAKNDIKYVELPFATQVVEVTCDNAPATGVNVVFAADKVTVSGFEWGKTYEAEGTFEVTTGSVVGAEVTVNFEFTTEARPDFNTPYKVDLGIKDYPYTANLELTTEIADDIAEVCQLPEANRGEGFDVAQWLEDVFVTNAPAVVNTIAYDGKSFNPSEGWKNNLELSADGSQVYTKYSYLYEGYQGVMPTEYKYTKEMTTYYGQKIVLEKTLKFTLPTYVIKYNEFWVDHATMSSTISPSWVTSGGKVSGFSVQNIDMYDAFTLHTKDGEPALDEAAMAAANLKWVFDLELDGLTESPLPSITDNVITYNSALGEVGVDSKLYLVNKKEGAEWSKIELATNYNADFSNYVVKKYDPLLDLDTVAPIEKVLTGPSADPYIVNLADHLNLSDKLGRSFIKNGEFNADNYDYSTDFFGLALDFDVEAAKAMVSPNIADKISIEEITDFSGNVVDCVVKFTYNVDLTINQDIEIVVPVSYKYTWGETSTEITVKFKK